MIFTSHAVRARIVQSDVCYVAAAAETASSDRFRYKTSAARWEKASSTADSAATPGRTDLHRCSRVHCSLRFSKIQGSYIQHPGTAWNGLTVQNTQAGFHAGRILLLQLVHFAQ